MNNNNKELLEKVINDRLSKSLNENDGTDKSFDEAMDAIDRQIKLDKDNKDILVKCVEIGTVLILTPLIEAGCKKIFAKMICEFEKDYTFTTTAGKTLSSLFRFK